MQTTKKPAATAVDMPTVVKNAIHTAPSLALMITEQAKLAELTSKMNAEWEGIQRLKDHSGKNSQSERVSSALQGKPIADESTDDLVQSATIRWQTYKSAVAIQEKAVSHLEAVFYSEVNAGVKPLRQEVVTRVAAALVQLREAADEDAAINMEISRNGVNAPLGSGYGITQSPVIRSIAVEHGWIAEMRSKGYTV